MTTTLQQMKGIEEKREKARILKILSKLKETARRVQEDKERCSIYLAEVCKDAKEQKQVIDWINSLDDVALSDEDKAALRDDLKASLLQEKKTIERRMDEKPEQYFGNIGTMTSATTNGTMATFAANSGNSLSNLAVGNYVVSNAASNLSIA